MNIFSTATYLCSLCELGHPYFDTNKNNKTNSLSGIARSTNMFGFVKTTFILFIFASSLIFSTQITLANGLDFAGPEAQKRSDEALSTVKGLSKDIQTLKQEVIELNKELQALEEELLFPSNTQTTIFLSLDGGTFFTLESVKVKLDDQVIASHLYSDKQRQALMRGGIQKLHLTNLSAGNHKIDAFFTGLGPNGRPYKRAATLNFKKGQVSQFIELSVSDDSAKQVPTFDIHYWN